MTKQFNINELQLKYLELETLLDITNELNSFENVQLIKGAAALKYGGDTPGGIIILTSNKKKLIEKIQNSELYGYIDEIYISDKYINAILLPINYKRERGTSITKKEWEIDENEIIKRLIKKLNES